MRKHERSSTEARSRTDAASDSLRRIFLTTFISCFVFILITFAIEARWEITHLGTLPKPTLGGVFGDFLSGVLGPVLSLVSIYLVVLTLREQRRTTLDERRAEEVEGFENRFYRMIDMHRTNVSEMSLQSRFQGQPPILGKRVFLAILGELQIAVKVVREENVQSNLKLSTIQELQVAYYYVFFGIGDNSLVPLFRALQSDGVSLGPAEIVSIEQSLASSRRLDDTYYKFDGHQVRLGHYYRHLFQSVAFVDNQTTISDKHSYIKTLRAQLSTHEQMLLLINSLTPLGWRWLNQELLKTYGLVKNIPSGMLERYCGVSVRDMFGPDYWEDAEVISPPKVLDSVKRVEIIDAP